MEDIAKLLSVYLGGVLTASIGFMLVYTARLAKFETQMGHLCEQLANHIKTAPSPCPLHLDFVERLTKVEERLKIEERKE